MITCTLQIQREKVNASGTGISEQEVMQIVDNVQIYRLLTLTSQSANERINASSLSIVTANKTPVKGVLH